MSTIDPQMWQQHAFSNRLQTLLLLAVMAFFLALLGWLLGGVDGLVLLTIVGAVITLLTPRVAPYLVMRLYRAEPLNPNQAPELFRMLGKLSYRAKLPIAPKLYYIPSGIINAFATGHPDSSAIGITDGLLRNLSMREVTGVIAHEVSHIKNNDTNVMGLADLFSRLTSVLSLFGQLLLIIYMPFVLLGSVTVNWFAVLLLVLAPQINTLAQFGLSRTREYDADINAVGLTEDPQGLALALVKIEKVQGGWMERLLFPGRRLPEPSLLRTHPPIQERVRRLLSLEKNVIVGSSNPRSGAGISYIPSNWENIPVKRKPVWHISGLWH